MTSRGKFWRATGGARQNFGGAVEPPGTSLAPPVGSTQQLDQMRKSR